MNRKTEKSKHRKKNRKLSEKYVGRSYQINPIKEPEIEREYYALKIKFTNANLYPEVLGEDRLSWNNYYFLSNAPSAYRRNVQNYSKIPLINRYDVDLERDKSDAKR